MIVKLDQIKGVGPVLLKKFRRQHIWSTYDLVLHYPKRYEDFSIQSLSSAKNLEKITVQGEVIGPIKTNPYGKVHVITCQINIMNESIAVVIFNRKYLVQQLTENAKVIVKGTYHLYQKKIIASYVALVSNQKAIKPYYHIEGIYDRTIQHLIEQIFLEKQVQIFENLPLHLLKKYALIDRLEGYKKLHLPKNFQDIEQAKRRFKYEEAFYLQLQVISQRKRVYRQPKPYDIDRVKTLIKHIPFDLTNDQKRATNDIFKDFKHDYASMRLLQGDVGSGKTIVALIAAYAVVTAHEQVAIMAPTTILAKQHYMLFKQLLKDVNIALISQDTKNKDALKKDIAQGQYDIIIGTHALIEEDVVFNNLGFVVIDEQHKFGVSARQTLIDKGQAKDVLYLTATPIPRTLAMIAYGPSHVSRIKEKPKNRQPVKTLYIDQNDDQKVLQAIKETIDLKQHVFVVVPAITSDKVDNNIETTQDKLKALTNNVFILHGQLTKDNQQTVIEQFKQTQGSILLATTMIEVGIDIPSATLMVIYSAHHFGLAQLHQLRGRIGRGTLKSTCYLVSEKQDLERLSLMTKTTDGFILSAYDLKARGPGDFVGVEQSGYLTFQFLDLTRDTKILELAYDDVKQLLESPDFKTKSQYQYLRNHIKKYKKI